MNSARIFASRSSIIEWINRILQIEMTKIQQLGSGVIYCLLIDAAYEGRVPIPKIKWYANTEVDYIQNFRILQNVFHRLGIQKKIEVSKLIKSKYQDNLDFIQWLKWFIQPKIDQKKYQPVKRRQNRKVYLDFYQHKILKVPADFTLNNKDKLFVRTKNSSKINKKLKKKYQTNQDYLEIFQCRTEQSEDENQNQRLDILKGKSVQKHRMLHTLNNFRRKDLRISQLDEYCLQQNTYEPISNKENTLQSINKQSDLKSLKNIEQNIRGRQSVECCLYSSPKQIKKFYFPQRFSQRLKKRVDLINGLSQIKKQDFKENDSNILVQQQNQDFQDQMQ